MMVVSSLGFKPATRNGRQQSPPFQLQSTSRLRAFGFALGKPHTTHATTRGPWDLRDNRVVESATGVEPQCTILRIPIETTLAAKTPCRVPPNSVISQFRVATKL